MPGVSDRFSGITGPFSKIQRPTWDTRQDDCNEPGYSSDAQTKKSATLISSILASGACYVTYAQSKLMGLQIFLFVGAVTGLVGIALACSPRWSWSFWNWPRNTRDTVTNARHARLGKKKTGAPEVTLRVGLCVCNCVFAFWNSRYRTKQNKFPMKFFSLLLQI